MQMQPELKFSIGDEETLRSIDLRKGMPIFSNEVKKFLESVSRRLMRDAKAKTMPDVLTFAFWCRKASLNQMERLYSNDENRVGRGVIFHIAPSNVPTNFAYSMAIGLLAGNANIVRLPSRNFPAVEVLCSAMRDALLDDVPELRDALCLLRYGHNKKINDEFSRMCHVRVLWGGDHTVNELRQSPLRPMAKEVVFADRYSIAVLDVEAYGKARNKREIAQAFYNDTYLSDQNACTSPRLIIWLGNDFEEVRDRFWDELRQVATEKEYHLHSIQAVDKLSRLLMLGVSKDVHWKREADNLIFHIELQKIEADIMSFQGNSGFFLECIVDRLEDILPICHERLQTLSYYGVKLDELKEFIRDCRPKGIDRIVPIGRTMEFSTFWDGFDLIREMSRKIYIHGDILIRNKEDGYEQGNG